MSLNATIENKINSSGQCAWDEVHAAPEHLLSLREKRIG